MPNQPDLFTYQPLLPPTGESIQVQFECFHRLNPSVYDELVALAREAKARGFDKWGIGSLWEVLRWRRSMDTVDPCSDFKLNNNLRSRYARLILTQEPDLAGFFETRELRAA